MHSQRAVKAAKLPLFFLHITILGGTYRVYWLCKKELLSEPRKVERHAQDDSARECQSKDPCTHLLFHTILGFHFQVISFEIWDFWSQTFSATLQRIFFFFFNVFLNISIWSKQVERII